jgi:NADH:ubiquinone oxidoreductase subunit H
MGDYHVQFFGKGVDTYFQARANYEAAPLLFQSMYICFLGGWLPILDIPILQAISHSIWFSIKVFFFLFVYIWVRASFPQYHYELMRLC